MEAADIAIICYPMAPFCYVRWYVCVGMSICQCNTQAAGRRQKACGARTRILHPYNQAPGAVTGIAPFYIVSYRTVPYFTSLRH